MPAPTSLALLAFRRWWFVGVGMVLLGALLGFLTGSRAPYSAVTLLQVDVTGTDQTSNAQTLQTALQLVDSGSVYSVAAAAAAVGSDDLQTRTKVALLNNAPLVSVTVTAPSAAAARKESAAVVDAALANLQSLSDRRFVDVRASGQHAVDDGKVNDPPAEQARRQTIGIAIASQQGAALAAATLVTPLGPTQDAGRSGLAGLTAILVGALAGLLLGMLVIVGINRRGRIRRPEDALLAGPGIDYCPRPEAIARLATICVAGESPLVAVMAMRGIDAQADLLAHELQAELRGEGMEALLVQSTDIDLSRSVHRTPDESHDSRPVPALAMPKRAKDLVVAGADVFVFVGLADGVDIARVNTRAEGVLLVVNRGVTRVGELRRAHAQLSSRRLQPIVVVAGAH